MYENFPNHENVLVPTLITLLIKCNPIIAKRVMKMPPELKNNNNNNNNTCNNYYQSCKHEITHEVLAKHYHLSNFLT